MKQLNELIAQYQETQVIDQADYEETKRLYLAAKIGTQESRNLLNNLNRLDTAVRKQTDFIGCLERLQDALTQERVAELKEQRKQYQDFKTELLQADYTTKAGSVIAVSLSGAIKVLDMVIFDYTEDIKTLENEQ